MQVYQQTRNRRLTDRERQAIWELMRFADEPAECRFTRQVTRTNDPEFRPVNRPINDLNPSTSWTISSVMSKSCLFSGYFVMGAAGFEPATSRV